MASKSKKVKVESPRYSIKIGQDSFYIINQKGNRVSKKFYLLSEAESFLEKALRSKEDLIEKRE